MFKKGKSGVAGDPKRRGIGIETEEEVESRSEPGGQFGGDPLRKKRPHICSD